MTAICQRCGYDIEAVGPVERGDCHVAADGAVTLGGRELALTNAERELFHALMRGGPLRTPVIADRMGCADNSVRVLAHRINHKFADTGALPPIMSSRVYCIV